MSSKISSNSKLLKKDITTEQEAAIDALYSGNVLLIAEAGFGKAVVGQSAAQELIASGVLKRVLVVAPLGVCDLTWATEWKNWEHLDEPGIATGKPAQRDEVIKSDKKIVVLNIENLKWFLKEYPTHDFDGLLIDEISKFKNAGGAIMKALRPKLKSFLWRCGMTATPVAEAGLDLYSQVLIIDNGAALGRSQERFKRRFFMQLDYKGYSWGFQRGGAEALAQALKEVVHVADAQDYTKSLPAVKEIVLKVEMSAEARAHYKNMARDLFVEIGARSAEAPNLAVASGKLQQIANGFIYDADSEAIPLGTEKHEIVKSWLAKPRPLIVVYQWDFEKAFLRSLGVSIFADDKKDLAARWNAGEITSLALHPKSAAHGLNLQAGGSEMLIMSPFWSADAWEQIFSRIWRRGQKAKSCTRAVLVCTNTVEELCLAKLQTKKLASGALVNHLKNF